MKRTTEQQQPRAQCATYPAGCARPRALFRAAVASLLFLGPGLTAGAGETELNEPVNRAIERGVRYLRGMPQSLPNDATSRSYPGGATCLAFYTLLICGVAADDRLMIELEEKVVRNAREVHHTYTLTLALLGLLAADAERHASLINEIITRLEVGQLRQADAGAWGYVVPFGRTNPSSEALRQLPAAHWDAPPDWWDHSNAQYAILGLRAAADFGFHVDTAVFRRAAEHFLDHRNAGGGFGYSTTHRRESYTAMTTGVCGSLVMCSDLLGEGPEARDLRRKIDHAVRLGARWTGARLRYPLADSPWPFYGMYAVERFGHYSHTNRFGKTQWYEEGARWLVEAQREDGSWAASDLRNAASAATRLALSTTSTVTDTCFALLFLRRSSFVHTQTSDEVFVLLRGIDSQARPSDLGNIRGRIIAAGRGAVPQLVKGLFLPAEPARLLADECLRELTGEDFGYQSARDGEELRLARDEWVKYVLENYRTE